MLLAPFLPEARALSQGAPPRGLHSIMGAGTPSPPPPPQLQVAINRHNAHTLMHVKQTRGQRDWHSSGSVDCQQRAAYTSIPHCHSELALLRRSLRACTMHAQSATAHAVSCTAARWCYMLAWRQVAAPARLRPDDNKSTYEHTVGRASAPYHHPLAAWPLHPSPFLINTTPPFERKRATAAPGSSLLHASLAAPVHAAGCVPGVAVLAAASRRQQQRGDLLPCILLRNPQHRSRRHECGKFKH